VPARSTHLFAALCRSFLFLKPLPHVLMSLIKPPAAFISAFFLPRSPMLFRHLFMPFMRDIHAPHATSSRLMFSIDQKNAAEKGAGRTCRMLQIDFVFDTYWVRRQDK